MNSRCGHNHNLQSSHQHNIPACSLKTELTIHKNTPTATASINTATNLSSPLQLSKQALDLSNLASHVCAPCALSGNGNAISLEDINPQHSNASWIFPIASPSLALNRSSHLSRSAHFNPPNGAILVPANVATTVWYTSRATIVNVDGKSTGGIVDRALERYLGLVLRDVASALEVSSVRPAIGGRARVRAFKAFGMGRE